MHRYEFPHVPCREAVDFRFSHQPSFAPSTYLYGGRAPRLRPATEGSAEAVLICAQGAPLTSVEAEVGRFEPRDCAKMLVAQMVELSHMTFPAPKNKAEDGTAFLP